MFVLFHRPLAHGLVARHRRKFTFVKDEARRPMREPANVFKSVSQQTAMSADEAAVHRPADGTDEGKRETLGQLRTQVLESCFTDKVADKKSGDCIPAAPVRGFFRCRAGGRRAAGGIEKPVAAQAAEARGDGAVSAKIRSGKRPDPGDRNGSVRQRCQRPSKG